MVETDDPILAFVAEWREKNGCACPVSALCQAFLDSASQMEAWLAVLESRGLVARPRGGLGERDVALRGVSG